MSYTLSYIGDCTTTLPLYECSPCPSREKGRVSWLAILVGGYEFTDPTDLDEWETAISNGDVIFITNTKGTYNGGSPIEEEGYGRVKTDIVGYDHELVVKDLNFVGNKGFYQLLHKSKNNKVAFGTETQAWFSDNKVSMSVKAEVQESLDSDVVAEIMVKWSTENHLSLYTAPDGLQETCVTLE